MFGGNFNVAALTAKAREEDDQKPKIPPPPPTPLDFPSSRPKAKDPENADPSLDLLKLFSNILRTGPSQKHLEALNVNLEDNVALADLVPQDYLPPPEWAQDPAKAQSLNQATNKPPPNELLSNGGPWPGREAFYTRLRELSHSNEDAFRAARQRPPRPGAGLTRILHFRKFWEALLMMSEYWDSSLDNYSRSSTSDGVQTKSNTGPSAMDVDRLATEAQNPDMATTPAADKDQGEETYTGRRKDTGRNMPPKFREETVFSFVEPLTWCFRCRLEHARMQPRVKMSGMILPLPHNGNVYRTPEEPRQARRGILEGPLAGLFCRDQLVFRRPEEAEGEGKQEILDLLREIGIGLMQAQKRVREGTTEELPGEGQWWATKPRWGGGSGGEVGLSEDEAIVSPPGDDGGPNQDANPQGPPPGKRPRRFNRAAAWKELRAPTTMWERGITYMRIGCEKEREVDNIYLFSALNHHISIVHLRVSQQYLSQLARQYSAKGNPAPVTESWYRLEMRRTRWYDLFISADRIEAMRGIWAVLGYQMRGGSSKDRTPGNNPAPSG